MDTRPSRLTGLAAAVFTTALSPWALAAIVSFGPLRRKSALSRAHSDNRERMLTARREAVAMHLATVAIIAAAAAAVVPMAR